MASLAAVRYAQALFELGKEEERLDVFKDDLLAVETVINENEELLLVLKHPKVEKGDRKAIIGKVFDGFDPLMQNFLKLLIDRNRFQIIRDIKNCYIRFYNEFHNIEVAHIYSAEALTPSELESIVEMLRKRYQKTIEYTTEIDKTLLAGVRIKVHDEILDNTIENQLTRMKEFVIQQGR